MEEATMEQIEAVLEERVRPALARHGGDIRAVALENGVLQVRLLGQCSGCPSAELTMEQLVGEQLRAVFPALRVALVTGVSDALLDEARRLLRERRG